ncbi:erythromycin esterase family protein [Streptomyces sp. RFCAC02]|uniref:erythromycin esterase family protein n=1 Tax=Streptomyces sp. RFCAC02 TaxID=2499143 RepID=UPI00102177A6|nr:erythromycin esterase family protein [Streptomyces sp. RFCAC02]
MRHIRPARRLIALSAVTVLAAGALGTGTAAARSPHRDGGPAEALNRAARPLGDLASLGRMIGDARVVGLGEASHSAHEFFTLKQRVFRHLVEAKGFTTFALEVSWSTGLRLDAYVTRGAGDPARIMDEEFVGEYAFWNTEEYLDLIHWMRHYNVTHPDRPRLRFVGNDLGYAGPEAFDQVTDYLARHRPALADRVAALYEGLRPADGTQAGAWMAAQRAGDIDARRAQAERADAALALLRDEAAPADGAYARAVQNATAIAQSFTAYAYPDERFPERMRYRDQVLAANTAWWVRNEGGRVLLASSNGHVGYVSDNPEMFPRPAGAFLRDDLGDDYVSVGLTFNEGTINALPDFLAQQPGTYTVDPAPEGYNEHTLDRVRLRDFSIDLRTVPRAAREWLGEARPTRSYGLYWSTEAPEIALGASYDILVHLHEVEAGHLR